MQVSALNRSAQGVRQIRANSLSDAAELDTAFVRNLLILRGKKQTESHNVYASTEIPPGLACKTQNKKADQLDR